MKAIDYIETQIKAWIKDEESAEVLMALCIILKNYIPKARKKEAEERDNV